MTFEEAKKIVAIKHHLGSTLVTGHKAGYFEEAAELYANAKIERLLKKQSIEKN